MLYQTNIFTYPQPNSHFDLNPGVLGLVPVTVGAGSLQYFAMNQIQPNEYYTKQDRSLLVWLSAEQGGNPVIEQPAAWANFHLTALQRTMFVVYDTTDTSLGPFDIASFGVLPGTYWLNVLNLVNETNAFFLEIATGD